MRILYIDIDSLRPDHLGCYGYHRNTSPVIDSIAAQGVRFEHCYVSDSPCLPSRSALFSGRFGIHNGVVGHGGSAADPFTDGATRGFNSTLGRTSWMHCLRELGYYTASISSFPERHSAWHMTANFNECYNPGLGGYDDAHHVTPYALNWLQRHAADDNWFLHVNYWDPHTPYSAPAAFGNPFADDPLPGWYTEAVRARHWRGAGPHSAQEVWGFVDARPDGITLAPPTQINDMQAARVLFDGYDRGIRYMDEHIGDLIEALNHAGVLEQTMIIISADHGENLGELNIYADHQTADMITNRVPLIVRAPGLLPAVQPGLIYQIDFAATLIELLGGTVPDNWDGVSFAAALGDGQPIGRESLVISQGAWSCQRGVRFGDYLLIRSYHDGYHNFPDVMLYNIAADPHEQQDIATAQPDLVRHGLALLDRWMTDAMRSATQPTDPMWGVLREGGPLHTRGELPAYLQRLRQSGRADMAEQLAAKHPSEAV